MRNLINVSQSYAFHLVGEPADERWFACGDLRDVSEAEKLEIQRLTGEAEKLQTLLETIRAREEFKFHPLEEPYADHVYCTVCRECVTCNLRPCRDGGEHTLAPKEATHAT